jgi:hypothetical protein
MSNLSNTLTKQIISYNRGSPGRVLQQSNVEWEQSAKTETFTRQSSYWVPPGRVYSSLLPFRVENTEYLPEKYTPLYYLSV